jgi:hypothetical protein
MPRRRVLLDTSFVLALENRRDRHHERAKALDRELLQDRSLTVLHWGILCEIGDGYARIGRRSKGQALLDRLWHEERYYVLPLTDSLIHMGLQLYQDRPDKEWGLTDCVSFVLMTREGITEALTADEHFRQAGFQPLLLQDH